MFCGSLRLCRKCIVCVHCDLRGLQALPSIMLAQRLLALRTSRHRCQGLAQLVPVQGFAADASQKSLDEDFTVTVNPFKGHRLEPPGREVKTSGKELMEMFKVCLTEHCQA